MFTFRKNGHFYERIGKKGEPVCIDDELPFDIPDNWEWCRFGHIVNFSLGKTPPRKEPIFWDDAKIPWVSISDMVDGKIINTTKENVNNYALEKSFKGILIPKGTLLMSFKLTVGKVSILGLDAVHNEAIISINPFVDENNCFRDYLFRILPLISQTGDTKSAIKGKTLNSKSLNKLLIPLPSLKEQKRIINKIEDILPLIEEYGVNEEQLDKLNSEFPDKLRSSILQEAVQGKLVPQDPTDEPASVLLEKIKEEKERLIKEKKIKRNKNESYIFKENNHFYEKFLKTDKVLCIDEELTYDIPQNWELVRLDQIGVYKKGPFGSALKKSMFVPKSNDSIKVYEQKNAIQKNHELGDYYITNEYYSSKMKGFTVEPGDIIVSCAGTIGETYVMPKDIELGIINQALMKMKIVDAINLDYFLLYFDYMLKKSAIKYSKGSAIKNIPPFKIFKRLLLPIPPINEQKRIIKIVNTLKNEIDNL